MKTPLTPHDHDDDRSGRSPYAIGYEWSVIVSSIAMEMALPPLFGIWLDGKCGTLLLFTVLGAALGMTTALLHLLQIDKKNKDGKKTSEDTKP